MLTIPQEVLHLNEVNNIAKTKCKAMFTEPKSQPLQPEKKKHKSTAQANVNLKLSYHLKQAQPQPHPTASS